jgi:hypothetical protein
MNQCNFGRQAGGWGWLLHGVGVGWDRGRECTPHACAGHRMPRPCQTCKTRTIG